MNITQIKYYLFEFTIDRLQMISTFLLNLDFKFIFDSIKYFHKKSIQFPFEKYDFSEIPFSFINNNKERLSIFYSQLEFANDINKIKSIIFFVEIIINKINRNCSQFPTIFINYFQSQKR